jgi:hypothetical protein
MKRILHSIVLTVTVCLALSGCKGRSPELAGKWSGTSDLASSISSMPGSTNVQKSKPVAMQMTLTINQNGGGFTGDASVAVNGQPAVHLPITAGTIDEEGKVSFEAERSGFSNVHLSFNGKVAAGQLSGSVALKMDTLVGVAQNSGAITLSHSA